MLVICGILVGLGITATYGCLKSHKLEPIIDKCIEHLLESTWEFDFLHFSSNHNHNNHNNNNNHNHHNNNNNHKNEQQLYKMV